MMIKIRSYAKIFLPCVLAFAMNPNPGQAAFPDANDFMKTTGYEFSDTSYLRKVFHHPSRHPDNQNDFERLEFLGDKVLDLIVAEELYQTYPEGGPGQLTMKVSEKVSNINNSEMFDNLNLLNYTDYQDSGAGLQKIKADTCEALIGAVRLDGGLEAAKHFIQKNWFGYREEQIQPTITLQNARHELYKILNLEKKLSYQFKVHSTSPNKVQLHVQGNPILNIVEGTSKNDVKRKAALLALQNRPILQTLTKPTKTPKQKKAKIPWKVKIQLQNFTETFEASSQKTAKRKAAKAAYEKIIGKTIDQKKSCHVLHAYCQAHKIPLPEYRFLQLD